MEFAEVYLELRRGGGVKVGGDCRASGHEGEIELFDWRWGLELADQSPDGKNEDRQAKGRMLSISKAVDRASVPMMSLLQNGETCDQATLTIKQSTQKGVVLKLILKGVRLMSCKLNVTCGDMEVVLDEDWALSYDKLEVRYMSASTLGSGGGGLKTFSLETPPGISQEEPVKLSSANVSESLASSSREGLAKEDVVKILEEYLKKAKLIK